MKFLYTNMELNLPHHLNYVAALPCKCTQRIMHVKPLTFCTNKHQTLFSQTCGIQISQIWTQSRSGLSCNIVSTRQKSVAWMNGGWSTSDVALNSWLSTWLLTTSVEESSSVHPFEFEHNLWTDDINFVSVCHFQCNFCMTVSPLPCYIFQSTSVPETSTIRPTRVFVLQGSAPAKSWYGGRFYSTLGRRYLLSECRKNY